MKKRIVAVLAGVAMISSLTACGSTEKVDPSTTNETEVISAYNPNEEAVTLDAEERKAEAEKIVIDGEFNEEYVWTLSTTYASGTPQTNGFQTFSKLVGEFTDGAVTINVLADGALMSENDSFLAIKAGELEFAGCGPSTVYLYDNGAYSYILAPFLVPNFDSYKNVYNSEAFEEAKEGWRVEHNTRDVAGMAYRGIRNMSSNKEINSIEDITNLKLRMNDNQTWTTIWTSLGATTVPMALGELYTGLQNGTVDASEGPWEQIASNNLDEVQDYIVETGHVTEGSGIFMSNELYENLPQNYRNAIDKAGLIALAEMELEAVEMENQYRQQLIDGGCTYISDVDLSGFKTGAEESWDELFESIWNVTSLEEVQTLIVE